MLVIDAANVVGSRPDGWWRDRAGAAGKLVERLRAAPEAVVPRPVIVVLEGRARGGAGVGTERGVEVVHASGEGDDTIVQVAGQHPGARVVSADRRLGERVRRADGEVVGPTWLLEQLEGWERDGRG